MVLDGEVSRWKSVLSGLPQGSVLVGMTPARAVLLKSPWPRCFGHILNARFDTKYLTE